MSEQHEWGPWIEHDGSGCPVVWVVVRIVTANGRDEVGMTSVEASIVDEHTASMWIWSSIPDFWWDHRVIRYRIRKPRALQQLRNMVESLPADAREDALT